MPTSKPLHAVLPFLVLAGLASLPLQAVAQGTEEQTEACSGDAFTLCKADIPDVAKITACMRVHRSELSPKCRRVFDSSDAPKAAPRKIEAAKTPVAPKEPKVKRTDKHRLAGPQTAEMPAAPRRRLKPAPVPARPEAPAVVAAPPPAPSSTPGLDSYRASIAKSCEQGLIDAYTCSSTLKLLDGM